MNLTESETMTIIYALNQRAAFYEAIAMEYSTEYTLSGAGGDKDHTLRCQKRADEARALKTKINTGTLSIEAW